MDINFLVEKWKEFEEDKEKYSECMGYVEAREKNIPETNKLIKEFIHSKINSTELKTGIAKLSEKELKVKKKRITSIWGADGPKCMLLFNLIIKYSSKDELDDLDKFLRMCFVVPNDIKEASDKIDLFYKYIEKLSGTITFYKIKKINPEKDYKIIKARIKPSYSSAFITVFWDMQKLDAFPVYYDTCDKVIKKLDEKDRYYKRSNFAGENYKLFYNFNVELIRKLNEAYDKKLHFSDISTNYLKYIFEKYLEEK